MGSIFDSIRSHMFLSDDVQMCSVSVILGHGFVEMMSSSSLLNEPGCGLWEIQQYSSDIDKYVCVYVYIYIYVCICSILYDYISQVEMLVVFLD